MRIAFFPKQLIMVRRHKIWIDSFREGTIPTSYRPLCERMLFFLRSILNLRILKNIPNWNSNALRRTCYLKSMLCQQQKENIPILRIHWIKDGLNLKVWIPDSRNQMLFKNQLLSWYQTVHFVCVFKYVINSPDSIIIISLQTYIAQLSI